MSWKNTVCIYSANCFKPSTCVVSKPVQVMSAVRELWSQVDLCKCKHSINNAVLSCVNYSIQGYANAHSAEQVRLRYSKTGRYWAKPSACLANALQPTWSWLELGVRWHGESFSLIKMILIRGKINRAMGRLRVETCCLCMRLHRNILNNRVEVDWKYQAKEEIVPLPVCLAAMLFGIWLTQTIFILLQNNWFDLINLTRLDDVFLSAQTAFLNGPAVVVCMGGGLKTTHLECVWPL